MKVANSIFSHTFGGVAPSERASEESGKAHPAEQLP